MARVQWRVPKWAYQKFMRLTVELEDLDADSDIAYAIRDEIRSLPNYPHHSTEYDIKDIEVT